MILQTSEEKKRKFFNYLNNKRSDLLIICSYQSQARFGESERLNIEERPQSNQTHSLLPVWRNLGIVTYSK